MLDKETDLFKKLSRDFTKKVLGNYLPGNNCFIVSFPLSLHLDNYNFKNTLRAGRFHNDPTKGGTRHFWLKLDSEIENIIDPTAKQFYPNMSETILFGPKPKEYYELDQPFEKWFDKQEGSIDAYGSWTKALLKHEEKEPVPSFIPRQEWPQENKRDIRELLEINLRAASILYTECKQKNIIPSQLHQKYFTCICKTILKFHNKPEMNGLPLPAEFDRLLKDCLKSSEQ